MENKIKQAYRQSLEDIQLELEDEFDMNFERKSFFNSGAWLPVKKENSKGSLLIRSGRLRSSILSHLSGDEITFTSETPYAEIHNEGGVITVRVTEKMRGWAWYMFRKTGDNFYKFLALTKKSSLKITIPKRQFIGDDPQIDKAVDEIVQQNFNAIFEDVVPNIFK